MSRLNWQTKHVFVRLFFDGQPANIFEPSVLKVWNVCVFVFISEAFFDQVSHSFSLFIVRACLPKAKEMFQQIPCTYEATVQHSFLVVVSDNQFRLND